MPFAFDELLYGPLHDTFGTSAVVTSGALEGPVTLTVIDKTSGVELPGAGVDLSTVVPAAVARMSAVTAAGLTRAALRRAAIIINGITYRIDSTEPRPTPGGAGDGELWLFLSENP